MSEGMSDGEVVACFKCVGSLDLSLVEPVVALMVALERALGVTCMLGPKLAKAKCKGRGNHIEFW